MVPSPGLNNNDLQLHSGPIYRVPQAVPSAPSGGAGYSQLPTAQPVQHFLPVATSVSVSSSDSSTPGNQVAVDEAYRQFHQWAFQGAKLQQPCRDSRERDNRLI
jgi:hypothetical protein